MDSRWLTIDETCTVLRLNRDTVKRLCREGFLPHIKARKDGSELRILDPTPEYQEKLRLAAMFLHSQYPDIAVLHEKALFTRKELDMIVGWKRKAGDHYLSLHRIPAVRVRYKMTLYSAETIRKLLWKRSGRKLADGRSPIVLTELIEWFRKWESEQRSLVPTDDLLIEDEAIQRKLGFIARMSEADRLKAEADFTRKVELAKRVVQILESAKPTSS